MKKLIFKTISISIIITHLVSVCFQDISFAEEEAAPQSSSSNVTTDELIGYDQPLSDVQVLSSGGSQDSFSPEKAIKSFYLDPFSGTFSLSLPLFTPPGRKGVQPSLNLTYSSSNGVGPFGLGWRMDFGSIERSTKNGVPKYDATDTFTCSLGGANSELIPIGGGEYRAKHESSFLKFTFNNTHWEVKDKQGNTYYFGLDDNLDDSSKEYYVSGDDSKVFKWYLSEIKDTKGNYFLIRYFSDRTFEIRYTGKPGTDQDSIFGDTQECKFTISTVAEKDYSDSPASINYRGGFARSQWERIKEINVNTNSGLSRKYTFDYKQSVKTNRSLLTKITEYGSDGTESMPPIRFTYQDNPEPDYDISSIIDDPNQGDCLWNARFGITSFDRGHENFGPVTPPDFGVIWSKVYTQSSGTGNGSFNIDPTGKLSFYSSQDAANWFWTYLYVEDEKTLNVPFSSGNGGVIGVYINGDYSHSVDKTWNLKQGYNLVEITAYHQHDSFDFNLNYDLAGNVDLMNSSQVILAQLSCNFNADGFQDLGTFFSSQGKLKVALSNGAGFLPKETWIENFGTDGKLILGDFNGDGRTDACSFDSANGNWKIALSDGAAFIDDGVWLSGFGVDEQPSAGDFNGDGKSDICTFYKSGGSLYCRIAINRGGSFEVLAYTPCASWGEEDAIPLTGEFNGDGLTDLASFDRDTGNWEISLNDGKMENFNALDIVHGFGAGKAPVVSDFNSDGLTDIGYYDDAQGKIIIKKCYTFSFSESIELPNLQFNLSGSNVHIQSGDYNGDGLTDFCAYNTSGSIEVALSRGEFPDLLKKLENGIGGSLDLNYTSSNEFDNTGGDSQVDLPFVLPILKESIASDGQGNSYKTTYSYSGGLYDVQDKEFRGFGYAKITDTEGNYTESYFHQDDIYKGRPYKKEVKDKDGNLYSKLENTWQYREPSPGSCFPYLLETYNYIYDGDASFEGTCTGFEYDEYGNITRIISEGDVNVTGDEKTQVTEYTYNTDDWILSTPKSTYLLDNLGEKVSETLFYYDDNTYIDDAPTEGFLTKEEVWCYDPITTSSEFFATNYSYDSYGNVTSITDSLDMTTTMTYNYSSDSCDTYPETTSNVLSHTIRTNYDMKTGQLLSSTDPNLQTSTSVYDALGRLIKAIGPNDTAEYPSVMYEYDLTTQPTKVTKKIKIDYVATPTYLTSYSFYDGLGRLIETKSPGEPDPETGETRQILSGIVKFNERGEVEEKYLPYFVNESGDYVTPTYSTPYTVFSYDALGRVVQITNPDLTYSGVTYSDWVRTVTDGNTHYKTQYYDAYGRIIKIEEHNSLETYTTSYTYDALGNLTDVIDEESNTTEIWYDSLGRKIKMDDPDMGIWTYAYDKAGNLKTQIDAKGEVLEFDYDELNRLTYKKANGETIVSYYYDEAAKDHCKGRLSKIVDQSGSTEFFYDNLGRETKSIKNVDGSGSYTVERTYDALDRLTTLKYPDESIVGYEYNELGITKVTDVVNSKDYVSNVDYSPTGQITRVEYGNGTTTDYTYDPDTLRLANLTTDSPFGAIQDLNYQFDNVGNIKDITDNVNTATQSFLYDDLDRLIEAQGAYGTLSYEYDSIGNMTYKAGKSLTYGKDGRLPHAVTQYGSQLIDYDENGNMIQKGALNLTYDIENRLSKVEDRIFYDVRYDDYTKLLLHCDGDEGSVTFSDATDQHTVASYGDAQIDTSQSKFGGASGLLDGEWDYLIVPHSADLNFGSEDFTIDFQVRFNTIDNYPTFTAQYDDGVSFRFNYNHIGNDIVFYYSTDGVDWAHGASWIFPWTPSTDTWYHLALVRDGADLKVFVDGAQVGSSQDIGTDSLFDSNGVLWIGGYSGGGGISGPGANLLDGRIDEFRISKGIARWISDFTPPISAYETAQQANLEVALKPGWNFISFPVILGDSRIRSVLASIDGQYDQVSRYNAAAGEFEHYVGNSRYDQFDSFEYGKGYGIYITGAGDVSLNISGTVPEAPQDISLKRECNLIYSPRIIEAGVEKSLSPLKGNVKYTV